MRFPLRRLVWILSWEVELALTEESKTGSSRALKPVLVGCPSLSSQLWNCWFYGCLLFLKMGGVVDSSLIISILDLFAIVSRDSKRIVSDETSLMTLGSVGLSPVPDLEKACGSAELLARFHSKPLFVGPHDAKLELRQPSLFQVLQLSLVFRNLLLEPLYRFLSFTFCFF